MINLRKKYYLILIILFFLSCSFSCGPSITSFKVEPQTISSDDSIKVNWEVNGEPTLLVHQKQIPGDSLSKYLELTLVVQKGSKEVKQFVQVTVLPNEGTNEIIFSTTLKGDTLIAAGEKNSERWGNLFQILNVSNASDRLLIVKHGGKSVELNDTNNTSNALQGTPIEGFWELRTLLNEEEKNDNSLAPEVLKLRVKYQYKRR